MPWVSWVGGAHGFDVVADVADRGGAEVVCWWVVVVLLMVDWSGAVVCGLVGGDWKVFGGSVGGYVVDGWVDLGLGGGYVVWGLG